MDREAEPRRDVVGGSGAVGRLDGETRDRFGIEFVRWPDVGHSVGMEHQGVARAQDGLAGRGLDLPEHAGSVPGWPTAWVEPSAEITIGNGCPPATDVNRHVSSSTRSSVE